MKNILFLRNAKKPNKDILLIYISSSKKMLNVGYFTQTTPNFILNNLEIEPILDKLSKVSFYENIRIVASKVKQTYKYFVCANKAKL